MEKNIREIKIEELNLRNKTKRVLLDSGKTTLGDLLDMDRSSFERTPGLGGAYLNEIKEYLYKEHKHNIPGAEVSEKNEDGSIDPSKFYVHDFEVDGFLKGALYRNNIKTLDDLLKFEPDDLFKLRGLGREGLTELKEYLSKFNSKFQTIKKSEFNEDGTVNPSKFYVHDFEVSTAVQNSLYRNGVETLEDLLEVDIDELLTFYGFGEHRLKELSDFLSKYGYKKFSIKGIKTNEDGTVNLKETHIGDLKLRDKIINTLVRNNIRTLEDLLKLDYNALKNIPKFDDDCILDLEIALNELGYSIKGFEEASAPKETNTLKLSLKNNDNNK